MSVLILVLFVGLFLHDALGGADPSQEAILPIISGIGDVGLLTAIVLPKLIIALLFHLLVGRSIKALNETHETAALRKLETRGAKLRQLLVLSYLADLFLIGGLLRLRDVMGDLILVDELIILLPPLATTFAMWLSYYPIDARMREATFMSRMERGLPVQIWSRGQYLLSQLRHQWALMGLPLLLLAGWSETVQHLLGPRPRESTQAALLLGGSLAVFLFTPLIIRHIWDTAPLPIGPMRDKLMAMCKQHRVGVRELLLWRTFGGMINGAVMGVVQPLRYILLTDALLESMPAKQVEAVMAHELAHVRKHHMFWLLLVAAASMELLRSVIELTLGGVFDIAVSGWLRDYMPEVAIAAMRNPDAAPLLSLITAMLGWFFIFGWVSRRFERQADTFAVQHLAKEWHEENPTGISESEARRAVMGPLPSAEAITAALERGESPVVLPPAITPTKPTAIPREATETMAGALQNVADLNYIPTQRKSWRHGSIAWRQDYLRSLAGQPIESTSIDRQVHLIKWAGFAILLAAVAVNVLR